MAETKNDVTLMQFRSGRIYSGAWSRDYEGGSVAVVGLDKNGQFLAVDRDGGVQTIEAVYDELSQGFSSALALARSSGWEMSEFDRRFDEAKAGGATAVERAGMTDLSKEWRKLGDKLGFDGVLDDLAVIVDEPDGASGDGEWLLAKVKDVVDGLGYAGHTHAAIAVVASDLPHAIQDKIFQAGAQVLDVPKDFYTLGTDSRRSFLRSLFPPANTPLPVPAPASKNPDADPTRYIARNPELSAEDVADWWKRLAAPLGKD